MQTFNNNGNSSDQWKDYHLIVEEAKWSPKQFCDAASVQFSIEDLRARKMLMFDDKSSSDILK